MLTETLVQADALERVPDAWPKNDPTLITAAAVARILGVSRERVSGIARPPVAYGQNWPTFLIPDQEVQVATGATFRFYRRDYVQAIAALRELFPPWSPDRGGLYWGEWVQVLIGLGRTPWFQFYGATMTRDSANQANVASVLAGAADLAARLRGGAPS